MAVRPFPQLAVGADRATAITGLRASTRLQHGGKPFFDRRKNPLTS